MPKVFVLIFLLSIGLLGCQQEREELVTETAVSPQPTATTVPTATPSPTIVTTETAVPSPTPTLPSPLAGIADLTTLPEISIDETVAYTLKTPSYDFMRDWLSAARETPNRRDDLLIYYTADLLSFDFARNYPNGEGNLENIVVNIEENDLELFFYPEVWTVLQTAVVAHLNQNQIQLKHDTAVNIPAVTLLPYAIDLNGDGAKEWLVKVESNRLRILGAIPLSTTQAGQYAILPNTIEPISTRLYDEIAQVNLGLDFTGDFNEEILLAKRGYLGGPVGDVSIYSWNGYGFYLLEKIDISVASHKPLPVFETSDFNDDGVMDVKVTTFHEINFECAWDEVDIYSWVDDLPQHLLMEDVPPDIPQCAMFHAITPQRHYSDVVLAEKSRTELLEEALSQLTLETAPSADYLALGYLHLAIDYLAQNEDAKAVETFAQINTLPADSSFVQLVMELYEEESDLAGVCQRLFSEPELAEETDIRSYIHAGSVRGYFGPGSEAFNRMAICPYPSLNPKPAEDVFPSISVGQSVESGLIANNFQTFHGELLDFDSDGELEWIGLAENAYLNLVIYDLVDEVWEPVLIENTCNDCHDYFAVELRTENSEPQLVGLIGKTEAYGFDPHDTEQVKTPFLVVQDEETLALRTNSGFSSEELSLADIDISEMFPEPTYTPPLWRWITFGGEEKAVWEWVEELQTAVLTQTDPDISTKISELLNYLPLDDPEAQPYREHLIYLLGYHYELHGEEEEAVNTYLDLIEQNRSSPWAWLAWARLEEN